MQLEPGMRVRCVDADQVEMYLSAGTEYIVRETCGDFTYLQNTNGGWLASRFKPIVRVKMGRAEFIRFGEFVASRVQT